MPNPSAIEPASQAASAFAAGVVSVGLSYLGLEPAALFWALVGASVGISFASASGRMRAIAMFLAVVLSCSLFGDFLSHKYFGGDAAARNVFACLLAIAFHPLLNAMITRIPLWLDGAARKLGVGQGGQGGQQ